MNSMIKKFIDNESGATAIEYGLIAALVAIAAIVGMKLVGTQLQTTFNGVGTELKTAQKGFTK
jgi:pilus assembly protein Flp/PilA